MSHEERQRVVAANLPELDCDALLVTSLTNVRYLTGFSGSNGQVLITDKGSWFFSDPRYGERAKVLVSGAEIVIYEGRTSETSWDASPGTALKGCLSTAGSKKLGFESSCVTVAELGSLSEALPGIDLVGTEGAVEDVRRVKDATELNAIRVACDVAASAFGYIVDRIVPGVTESEIAVELEFWMRRNGAEAVSFEPIVGSGPLSAHIHHTPSDRTFEKGDLILMDYGALVSGYCSDLTRTVVIGPASPEVEEIYSIVLASQHAGISALRAGANGRDVDAAARKVMEASGHAEYFAHGLGHGVGLDIHEAPRLSKTSPDVLRAGEVVTVEPGIYIPGLGGVRIEDCVLVTEDGAEVLGASTKDELMEV